VCTIQGMAVEDLQFTITTFYIFLFELRISFDLRKI